VPYGNRRGAHDISGAPRSVDELRCTIVTNKSTVHGNPTPDHRVGGGNAFERRSRSSGTGLRLAAKKNYGGPVTSQGQQIFLSAALRGSDLSWLQLFGNDGLKAMADHVRYVSFEPEMGPMWEPRDFDFDRDYQRLGMMEALTDPVNPDLRAFKGRGGKLLSFAGWSNAMGGELPTIDYYETVERIIGTKEATQAFCHLFVIPGMNHRGFGEGAFAVDWLSYLETWVESGEPPEKVDSAHVRYADLLDKATDGDQDAIRSSRSG
jgi:hypothetical protein